MLWGIKLPGENAGLSPQVYDPICLQDAALSVWEKCGYLLRSARASGVPIVYYKKLEILFQNYTFY